MPAADSFTSDDGQSLTLWRWPTRPDQPELHWAHATGFSARVYDPLLNELSRSVNVLAWDMRGHGTSHEAANADTFLGWQTYYNDLTYFLRQRDKPIWLAGHSIGGMTSLAAAAQVPDKVAGILLIEPVILAGGSAFVLRLAKAVGQTHRFGYVNAAAKRRCCFANRQEAQTNYRAKRSFSTWSDEWLAAYVQHGFVESTSGNVCLACRPEWEALTFSHTEHSPWSHLGVLADGPPIHICAGEHRSTFPQAARRRFQQRLPTTELCEFPGTSHFLPMEETEQIQQWILSRMSSHDLPVTQPGA